MRIKGETPEEMAGFLDAVHAAPAAAARRAKGPVVVLPSYNGARKLPVLTPLLALLLAREGLPVLIHGTATESSRVSCLDVLQALDIHARRAVRKIEDGEAGFAPTEVLCPGLKRLLDVRPCRRPAQSGAQPGQADEPLPPAKAWW
jgi:anthranilate phosphoribosyltransferase